MHTTNNYIAMKAAYDAARASTNETERIEFYDELEGYAVEDCPVVPIWQGVAYAVTKTNIKGVYLDITQSWRMWYIYSEISPPTNRFFYILCNGKIYVVTTLSNSTITNFNFNQLEKQISFNVTGCAYTIGFCSITIPHELLGGPYTVSVDNYPLTTDPIWYWNSIHSIGYFTYDQSTHIVRIIGTTVIPEFPSLSILPLFMLGTLLAVMVFRKKKA